ncbi:RNA-binding domain-containing protein, partial [Daedalea quercina L-15889]
FAYVDFATPDAKTVAITLSENPLDGRRLLIKDGESGIPHAPPAGILRAQKQPAGPTLFLGNLGFETTEQSIRQLFASPRPKPADGADAAEGADDKPRIRRVRMGTFEDSGKCKGWAFVDFTSPEHATGALVNPKNHFLDGRKLVVEYASPDAAYGTERKRKGRAEDADADAEPIADGESASPKRRRVEDNADGRTFERGTAGKGGKPPRARPKPGAALAQAKRENAAIVPAQGRKIVF